MKSPYVQERLAAAAAVLDQMDGDSRRALYAAHLQMHTLLPEHIPAGELRRAFAAVHDRFTKRHPGDRQETSVIEVLQHLDDGQADILARDIRALHADYAAWEDEPNPEVRISPTPDGAARRVLVLFASTDGHTSRLAEFAGSRLTAGGHEVTVRHAPKSDAALTPDGFDAVFIAASVHWGRYQSSVIGFAERHHETLNAMPSALVSVSLAAAGVEQPADLSLEDCVARLRQETSWTPQATHHVGGLIRHTGYDYFKRLSANLIARGRGEAPDLSADYDLADYDALANFVLAFAGERTAASTAATPGV